MNKGQPIETSITPLAAPSAAVEEKPTLRGRIVSAMPLSAQEQRQITERFETLLDAHVVLTTRVDKKQLAGVRVEIAGRSYDGTLRGQLADLRKLLSRHEEEVGARA